MRGGPTWAMTAAHRGASCSVVCEGTWARTPDSHPVILQERSLARAAVFVWWGSLCAELPPPSALPRPHRLNVCLSLCPWLTPLDTRTHCTRTRARMQSLGPFHVSEILTHFSSLGAPSPSQSIVVCSCKWWHVVRIHHTCVAAPCWWPFIFRCFSTMSDAAPNPADIRPHSAGPLLLGWAPGGCGGPGWVCAFQGCCRAALQKGCVASPPSPECMGTRAPSRSDGAASFDFCQFASSLIIKW